MKRKYIFDLLAFLLLFYACNDRRLTKEEKLQDEGQAKYVDTAKWNIIGVNSGTVTIGFANQSPFYMAPRERLDSCIGAWTRTGDTLLVLLPDHHCLFQKPNHEYSNIIGEWSNRGDTIIMPGPDGRFHTVTLFRANLDSALKVCRTGGLLFIRTPHWLIMYTNSAGQM